MPPLLSEEEMDAMDFGDESDDEPMYTQMIEDICDGIQSDTIVNRIETGYKTRDHIKQRKPE